MCSCLSKNKHNAKKNKNENLKMKDSKPVTREKFSKTFYHLEYADQKILKKVE